MEDPNISSDVSSVSLLKEQVESKSANASEENEKSSWKRECVTNSFEFQQIENESCQSHGETNVFYEEDHCCSEKEVDNNSKMFKIFWVVSFVTIIEDGVKIIAPLRSG